MTPAGSVSARTGPGPPQTSASAVRAQVGEHSSDPWDSVPLISCGGLGAAIATATIGRARGERGAHHVMSHSTRGRIH